MSFLIKALAVHGTKYDYSRVVYSTAKTKVLIGCSTHGDFLQTPNNHLSGKGCSACGALARADKKTTTIGHFINLARAAHGKKYDYSDSVYKSAKDKITIRCSAHGEFSQLPGDHTQGRGCPSCGRESSAPKKKFSTEDFIVEAKKVHGPDKYSYEKSVYRLASEFLTITCPVHGDFQQSPNNHLQGHGCASCGRISSAETQRHSVENFIKKALSVHGELYSYEETVYEGAFTPVTITCGVHGKFLKTPDNHLRGQGCPACGLGGPSAVEIEFSDFVESLVDVKRSDRTLIAPQEIDCLVPSHKIGFEFCGLYFHSEKFRPTNYHRNKLDASNLAGFDLIHVFEDEWAQKPEIVKSVVRNRLGLTDRVVFARKTEVREVGAKECGAFLEANHLQGSTQAEIRLGLFQDTELLLVATFSNTRKVLGNLPEGSFELVRLCSALNTNVLGGFSKLLRHFEKTYQPKALKTFCDRRYFSGAGYTSVGFTKTHDSAPNYFYVRSGKRYSRYGFQKHKLAEKLALFDPTKSEKENMLANGYLRIYDCGNLVFNLKYPRHPL